MIIMVTANATKESEAGVTPSEQLLTEMGNFNEALVKAGVMLAGEGLPPSSKGARVYFYGMNRTVIDGPFAETQEVIASFLMWQMNSMDDAIAWAQRCPDPHNDECHIDVCPEFYAADFGEAFTPNCGRKKTAIGPKWKGSTISTESDRVV